LSPRRDTWIEAAEAAAIMTKNSGHPVSTDYVRLLSNSGKIRARLKNKRSKEYLKTDVEAYRVKGKGPNRVPAQQNEGLVEEPDKAVA
jgi:hypothetical protein